MDCYYKLRHLFYYKVRHGLLQIATSITKCDGFITNCDRYYKVRWLLQIATVQLLPSFFLFSCLIFFLLLGILVGFILVGNVFGKAFRILGLDERKGRWVVQQDFHADFQVNVTWCFSFSSGVLDWIVLTHFAPLKNILGNGVSRRSRLLGCLKARPLINPL